MAIFNKKAGGTKAGNLLRKVTQSGLGKAAISAASPIAGLAIKQAPKPKPMVFPVGAGLTAKQQVNAYKAIAPNSPLAKGIQSVKSASTGPQYTPVPGGPLAYTPVPGGRLDFTNNKSTGKYSESITDYSGDDSSITKDGPSKSTTGGSDVTASAENRSILGTSGSEYGGISSNSAEQATAGELVTGNSVYDYNLTPEQQAYEEALREQAAYNKKQAQQTVDPESIYQDTLRQFQGEIDATNEIYAQKLAEARMQGQSRLGTTRAENFNAGIVNSSFGNAAQERTQQFNTGLESGIQAEKIKMISQIENNARELGNKYYEAKKVAKEAGLESYVTNLKGIKDAKDAITAEIANNMFMSDVTPDELTPKKLEQIAKSAGVTVQSIKNTFKELQIAQAQAEAEAALKGQFNLSEGQARYDAKGNLIASRAKTYKGDGGSVSGGAGDLAITSQPGYSRLTAKQKSQADSIYNLTTAIEDYKNKINEGGTKRGVNAFGADSALLQTKYNSIIFAAAQAEGTGALQAADRQVIEKIIPDVTRFGRNFTGPFKGGLKGVNLSLDDQISKYKNNLGTYGLTYKKPTGQTGSAIDTQSNVSNTLTSPDGTQEVDLSELTPAEVAEAKAAGWQ